MNQKFFLKLALDKLITLFFISVLSFAVVKMAPGKPSQISDLNPRFSAADAARFAKAFDLDKPLPLQFVRFYGKLFAGKTLSFRNNQNVLAIIWERFLNSLPLFILSTIVTWALAFPTGIFAAVRRGRLPDKLLTFFSFALLSIPSYVLSYLFIMAAVQVFHVPVLGMKTFGFEGVSIFAHAQDRLWHMTILSLLSAVTGVAFLSRYVREQMSDVLQEDYIRTARAKGASEVDVEYHHALRNALLPFVTFFGLMIPELIGGSVIIENIFAWPGLGKLTYEAMVARDYPIILTINFITAVLVLFGNTVSDLLYSIVDPRIRRA